MKRTIILIYRTLRPVPAANLVPVMDMIARTDSMMAAHAAALMATVRKER